MHTIPSNIRQWSDATVLAIVHVIYFCWPKLLFCANYCQGLLLYVQNCVTQLHVFKYHPCGNDCVYMYMIRATCSCIHVYVHYSVQSYNGWYVLVHVCERASCVYAAQGLRAAAISKPLPWKALSTLPSLYSVCFKSLQMDKAYLEIQEEVNLPKSHRAWSALTSNCPHMVCIKKTFY